MKEWLRYVYICTCTYIHMNSMYVYYILLYEITYIRVCYVMYFICILLYVYVNAYAYM
jgi:hypothetical protein